MDNYEGLVLIVQHQGLVLYKKDLRTNRYQTQLRRAQVTVAVSFHIRALRNGAARRRFQTN